MSPLLRLDSYALAQSDGTGWRSDWCVTRRDGKGGRQFGEEAGELLQPKRSRDENNEYFEAPDAAGEQGPSSADLAYLHLREFLAKGEGPIDLLVSGGIDRAWLECLLGILEALAHRPRGIVPTALLAARDLAPGRYGIIELGRNRSWISIVEAGPDHVRLESVRDYCRDFGFYQVFTQWLERAAEAFATQHRFDVHRNPAANRERLFGQMRQAFAGPPGPVQLSLESRSVTLPQEVFQARWPKPALDEEGLDLRWLTSLSLPLPEQSLNFPCCAEPAPQIPFDLASALPQDGHAHRCLSLSR